jgi:hypothetical protein
MDRISIGTTVYLTSLPPFLKTADPMPMLCSPHRVRVEDRGQVLDQRPGGYYAVRFAQGVFLIDHKYLRIDPSPY